MVSLLPGWLPRLTLAQTLPYPHVATHCRFKTHTKEAKPSVIKIHCIAKVREKPVIAFICFTQYLTAQTEYDLTG